MQASVSMRVRVRACVCVRASACARAQPNGDAARRGPRRGWERTPQPCVRHRQSRSPRPRPRRRPHRDRHSTGGVIQRHFGRVLRLLAIYPHVRGHPATDPATYPATHFTVTRTPFNGRPFHGRACSVFLMSVATVLARLLDLNLSLCPSFHHQLLGKGLHPAGPLHRAVGKGLLQSVRPRRAPHPVI